MSSKQGAYGDGQNTDTSFRKTYDKAEYAAKAAEREAGEKEERKARYEAKLAGKKYYAPLTGDEVLTEARASRLDVSNKVGKISLVPAGASMGKRGQGAGFYCKACDLTFKDSKQWVDHENSMQHLRAIGQTGEVKRATAEEVHAKIERLWEQLEESKKGDGKTLQERLEIRKEEEDKEREERRAKKAEIAKKKREAKEKEAETAKIKTEDMYGDDVRVEGIHDDEDMMAMLGMTGFGSSKR